MEDEIVHQDAQGFRARPLSPGEFSAVAGWLAVGLEPPGGHDEIVRLASALSIASDGVWGNQVFWLIERADGRMIALAHGVPALAGPPRFDGFVWLYRDQVVQPAPFQVAPPSILAIAAFCRRYLGLPGAMAHGGGRDHHG